MEQILKDAKFVEAEEAEVFTVTSEVTEVRFETNRLKHMQTKQSSEMALRIIKDGRLGYASTNRLEESGKLAEMAEETAQFGMEAKFKFPATAPYPLVEIYDSKIEAVTLEEMVNLGQELINKVMAHTPEIICEAAISKGVTLIRLTNSQGGQATYKGSFFDLGIEGTVIRGTDMLFVGESQTSCQPLMRPKEISSVVVQQLEWAKEVVPVPSRTMPVIFTPNGVASALIMSLMAAFNGKTVLEGASPIGSKRGKRVFDKKLWLWDDPTLANRPTSRPFDDEAVPSQRTMLIEEGKVVQFYYDLQTAGLARAKSTGNGSRERGGLPVPAPSAFVIANGNTPFDQMVQDMKEGLIIEHLLGAGQSNILGGEFSGNVLLGYKVENGKIVGRVKNAIVAGNVYQVLKEVAAVGSEAKWVGSMVKTPHIYCPAISVAAKS